MSKPSTRKQTIRLTLAQTTNWALYTAMGAEGTIKTARSNLIRSEGTAANADLLSKASRVELHNIAEQLLRCQKELNYLGQFLSSHNVNKLLRGAASDEKI